MAEGTAKKLKEEFEVHGLPSWFMGLVSEPPPSARWS